MLVAQVVNRNTPSVGPQDDVLEAARRLLECPGGVLPVVTREDRGARVVGLLRYRDAIAAMYGGADRHAAGPVATVMAPARCTCRASDSIGVALRVLRREGIEA